MLFRRHFAFGALAAALACAMAIRAVPVAQTTASLALHRRSPMGIPFYGVPTTSPTITPAGSPSEFDIRALTTDPLEDITRRGTVSFATVCDYITANIERARQSVSDVYSSYILDPMVILARQTGYELLLIYEQPSGFYNFEKLDPDTVNYETVKAILPNNQPAILILLNQGLESNRQIKGILETHFGPRR